MKVYEVPLTLAEHDTDIKSLYSKIPQSFVTRFCAYNLLRYQVSVYRTIGPLVIESSSFLQATRTTIKSGLSSKFSLIGSCTLELVALERLKKFP